MPPCGYRGGGCSYLGPLDFVLEFSGVLLLVALLIWTLRGWLHGTSRVDGPSDPDPDEPRPRHYDERGAPVDDDV